jgi:drug/metabolite transporter superfamily protein YnfA
MKLTRPWAILLVFLAAALLEVVGDAVVRTGLRGRSAALVVVGGSMLAVYGVVVNLVDWDFSKLLGVYVAVFAVISVLIGQFWFRETVPASTWLGLVLIVLGGLVIQAGSR